MNIVQMYETNDGELFRNEKEARNHEAKFAMDRAVGRWTVVDDRPKLKKWVEENKKAILDYLCFRG